MSTDEAMTLAEAARAMLRQISRDDPDVYARAIANSTGDDRETLIEQCELAARIPLEDHVLPLPERGR